MSIEGGSFTANGPITIGRQATAGRGGGMRVTGGIFTLVPLLLIAKQPDLGTAVTLVPVFIGVAFLAGLRTRLLGVLA